ncbi:MAG: thiamine-phosphate kinase [Pseudomonadota bacterium]
MAGSFPSLINQNMTEFELINFLTKDVARQAPNLAQGVGDDCAVFVEGKQDWLITSDMLLEEIHFDLSFTSFYLLGRKSLSVNLSDIAAMGGEPSFFTMNIGIPSYVSLEQIKELYQGLLEAAQDAGVILVGGDTSQSKKGLVISITMLGKVSSKGAILRKGAKPGDLIYVTGNLGSAALGLKCFQAGKIEAKTKPFLEKFNNPKPCLAVGKWLGENKLATAMIDISDGLLADLGHIVSNSQVGYELQAENIPLLADFNNIAQELKVDPWELALTGGEDYELVFTVSPGNQAIVEKNSLEFKITMIGKIVKDSKQQLILDKNGKGLVLNKKGYDHFG